MELRGKTILITGAGRGLGAAMAKRLAARGANLALRRPRRRRLGAQSATPAAALGVRAETYAANVAAERDVVGDVRSRRRGLRPSRRQHRQRRHPARRPARQSEGRRDRGQAEPRAVASRHRRQPDGRVPVRPRSGGAHDPAGPRRLHHQHLELVARRQFRPEQLLGGQSRRRGADRRLGQGARAS